MSTTTPDDRPDMDSSRSPRLPAFDFLGTGQYPGGGSSSSLQASSAGSSRSASRNASRSDVSIDMGRDDGTAPVGAFSTERDLGPFGSSESDADVSAMLNTPAQPAQQRQEDSKATATAPSEETSLAVQPVEAASASQLSIPRSTRSRAPAEAVTLAMPEASSSAGGSSGGSQQLGHSDTDADTEATHINMSPNPAATAATALPPLPLLHATQSGSHASHSTMASSSSPPLSKSAKFAAAAAEGRPLHARGPSSVHRKPWSRNSSSSPYSVVTPTKRAGLAHLPYGSPAGSECSTTAGAAQQAIYHEDHDPGRWHTDEKEPDDYLHEPEPLDEKGRPIEGSRWSHWYGVRGLMNLGTLAILTAAVFMLFMGYPILSRNYYLHASKKGGFNLGGSNATGQVPDLSSLQMRQSLVDADTPGTALTKAGLGPTNTETWQLVFSDEFNVNGRSFYPGDDPVWEAVNLYAGGTADYEWYDPAAVTTADGALVITVTQQEINNLNFRSGQLTSWNKFCFTGGYLEASVVLPGDPTVSGWWPAIWTMGNLGRANYGATTQGTWPYSYTACDRGTLINQTDADGLGPATAITSGGDTTFNNKYHTSMLSWQPGQKLSACTCPGEDHPGPVLADGTFKGRSAPEIDMFEAQVSNAAGGQLSLSTQFMPASADYKLEHTLGTEYTLNTVHGRPVRLNSYTGSVLQMAASAVASVNQNSYQNTGAVFSTWGFEYEPGADGYVTWWIDGVKAWTLTAAAVGADALAGIAQRPIPEEPMYMLLNVAISSGFGSVAWEELKFPATMQVDYVRLYQATDKQNTGCDPDDFPTSDYIEKHYEAYHNPNYTVWGGDPSTGGYGADWPRNRLYNGGNGCAEQPRKYPGRLRPNGINESPVDTVPARYSGRTDT